MVVGAVAIDAGVITAGASVVAHLANNTSVMAKVIKDAALEAVAMGAKGAGEFAAKIAQGALPIIKVMSESGPKYFAVAP